MSRVFMTAVAVIAISACGKKQEDKVGAPTPAADMLTSTQWCTVDSMTESLQIFTRYAFFRGTPNKTRMSHLWLNGNSSPIIYNVEGDFEWVPKTDDFLWSSRYTIELIEDEVKVRGLDRFNQQKAIFERILRNNPNLNPSAETFSPKIAVSIKHRPLLSDKDSEQVLYPCPEYSASFNAVEPSRPIMELNILLGQTVWNELRASDFTRMMSLKFPMDQLNTSDVAVSGSSWCSWNQMDNNSFFMNIITIGENRLAYNQATELTFRDDFASALNSEVERTQIYTVTENQKYILSESALNFPSSNLSVNVRKMLAAMRDSDGTIVLANVNPYRPELTSLRSFGDIYFKCDDPRPLELHANLKKNLPRFLELQRTKLQ